MCLWYVGEYYVLMIISIQNWVPHKQIIPAIDNHKIKVRSSWPKHKPVNDKSLKYGFILFTKSIDWEKYPDTRWHTIICLSINQLMLNHIQKTSWQSQCKKEPTGPPEQAKCNSGQKNSPMERNLEQVQTLDIISLWPAYDQPISRVYASLCDPPPTSMCVGGRGEGAHRCRYVKINRLNCLWKALILHNTHQTISNFT